MDNAIKILREHLTGLENEDLTGLDISIRADHIGNMNRIESAIQLLELCDSHGILPGSIVKQLPDTGDSSFQYVVANMNESTNPSSWDEVLFDGNQLWLDGGDLVIKR